MFRNVFGLSVMFFIIALFAALVGFGFDSTESWVAAKVFFCIFIVLAALSFVGGFFVRTRNA